MIVAEESEVHLVLRTQYHCTDGLSSIAPAAVVCAVIAVAEYVVMLATDGWTVCWTQHHDKGTSKDVSQSIIMMKCNLC